MSQLSPNIPFHLQYYSHHPGRSHQQTPAAPHETPNWPPRPFFPRPPSAQSSSQAATLRLKEAVQSWQAPSFRCLRVLPSVVRIKTRPERPSWSASAYWSTILLSFIQLWPHHSSFPEANQVFVFLWFFFCFAFFFSLLDYLSLLETLFSTISHSSSRYYFNNTSHAKVKALLLLSKPTGMLPPL